MVALALPLAPVGLMRIPPLVVGPAVLPLLAMMESITMSFEAVLGWNEMPQLVDELKRRTTVLSTIKVAPETKRMPLVGGLTPKMSRPRMRTTAVPGDPDKASLTTMPLPPASAPPSV